MQSYDTIRTDTWTISVPSDWLDKGQTESGALYYESSDGAKAMYISTWNLGDNASRAPKEVAESFKAADLKSLREMKGYSWNTVEDQTTHSENSTVVIVDSLAEANSYRIAGKILSRPPVVVRASFHDYACENYETSRAYFALIIESLCFYETAV